MGQCRHISFYLPIVLLLAACAAPMPLASAATDLENVEWRLIELDGVAVVPLSEGERPSLSFDARNKKAAGFNGCNNYFGQYQLDGPGLKFGPLAATRRACPDVQSNVESKLMAALEKTQAWEITEGTLSLRNDAAVVARFSGEPPGERSPDLRSLNFRSKVDPPGLVKLEDGQYRAPAAPGSASQVVVTLTDKRAFSTVADKSIGAVVVVTALGGTGSFYELVLLEAEGEGWLNTDTVLLDDRIEVHSVRIEGDQVVVAMKAHGPQDPMCCPTLEVTKRFAVEQGRLVAGADDSPPSPLVGTVWQWVGSRYNNDTEAVPPKPENYLVGFQEDGKLDIKADCNVKGGTYAVSGKGISMQVITSTMAACEEGSPEELFARDLNGAIGFFFRDGDLYIDLKYDSGTMKFSRVDG